MSLEEVFKKKIIVKDFISNCSPIFLSQGLLGQIFRDEWEIS